VIGLGAPPLIIGYITEHFSDRHPELEIVHQGADVMISPAPYRCDLCSVVAEPPWWCYRTGPGLPAEDPEWLVCDSCHRLIDAGERVQLDAHCLRNQRLTTRLPLAVIRQRLDEQLPRFLANLVGEPQREQL
jgi:hypothetical protein